MCGIEGHGNFKNTLSVVVVWLKKVQRWGPEVAVKATLLHDNRPTHQVAKVSRVGPTLLNRYQYRVGA